MYPFIFQGNKRDSSLDSFQNELKGLQNGGRTEWYGKPNGNVVLGDEPWSNVTFRVIVTFKAARLVFSFQEQWLLSAMKKNLIIPMEAYGSTNAKTNSIQKIASTGSAQLTLPLHTLAQISESCTVSQKEQHGGNM